MAVTQMRYLATRGLAALLLDSLMAEIGLNGGDINQLTNSVAGKTTAKVTEKPVDRPTSAKPESKQ